MAFDTGFWEALYYADRDLFFESIQNNAWQVQGQQLEEFAAREEVKQLLGRVATEQGQVYLGTGQTVLGGGPASVGSLTDTALELAQDAPLEGTAKELLSMGQGAMETGSGTGVYQSAGLLSLDVGVVGAAVAPLLGVSLGVGLYEENPEFWTKLSQRLLPFCYPDTTEIPGWLDIVESALHPGEYENHVVIDKRIVDSIKELFDEEGIGVSPGSTSELDTDGFTQPIACTGGQAAFEYGDMNNTIYGTVLTPSSGQKIILYMYGNYNTDWSTVYPSFIVCSAEAGSYNYKSFRNGVQNYDGNFELNRSYTYNNKTVHFRYSENTMSGYKPGTYSAFGTTPYIKLTSFLNMAAAAWTAIYGTPEPGYYPEDTSEWQGYTPSLSPYNKPVIFMKRDPLNPDVWIIDSVDGVEIAVPKKEDIPAGQPYPSVDPDDNPDPNRNADEGVPTGFIIGSSVGTTTNPTPEPIPDPDEDPTGGDDPEEETKPMPQPVLPVIPPPVITIPSDGESPDPTPPVVIPPFSSQNDGLISVYHPSDAQLKAFASWLWVTYADPSIEKLWNNPFDGVIGLMELYCTPTDIGTKSIRSGFLDSGVVSPIISRYTTINCGTITVPEYYGNYLDYSPYSKCHVYLPFIGIVELNVDDIVGHAVNITYTIDEYNGSCIAQITVAKSIEVNGSTVDYSNTMYQFSGNCAVELPLAGGTQSAIRAGLIQAAAYGLSSVIGGIAAGAMGNVGGAISQMGYGAANAIGSVVSAKSSVQHSGSFGSSYGAMGIKTPFITVTRPRQIEVINYNQLYGFPAHAMVTLGTCTGFTRVREVEVKSSNASDEEKKRIEELLKEGVYIN